jgi:hypothetical protein
MGFLKNIGEGLIILAGGSGKTVVHSTTTDGKLSKAELANAMKDVKRVLPYKIKAVSNNRQDIKTWKDALDLVQSDEPKNFALQDLYTRVMDDALLSSQMENRMTKLFGVEWNLVNPKNGEADVEQTTKLKDSSAWREITKAILETHYVEYNLIELSLSKNIEGEEIINIEKLPRTHIVPQLGRYYFDYTEDKFIEYRSMREYGVYILEFDSKKRGLINKAIPHVLMKKFSQSCWAELCEIYGIPPRFMKTNTQDPAMLQRAEQMMGDMGAAAWFVIDETEEFQFAQGVTTNGDVYRNLITLCNNEMSMLVSGAIIGQDTVNGNRSKDESAKDVLWDLVLQDVVTSQDYWNRVVLPALKKLGFIKGDVKFRYTIPEDQTEDWKRVVEALPFFDIDPEWVKKTFGIEIIGKKEAPASTQKLNLGIDFFD